MSNVLKDASVALVAFESDISIESLLEQHLTAYFDQHTTGVWMTVFAQHPEALCSIERKGLGALFGTCRVEVLSNKNPEVIARNHARCAVAILEHKLEPNCGGLTLDQTARVLREYMPDPLFRKPMRDQAARALESRLELVDKCSAAEAAALNAIAEGFRTLKNVVDAHFPETF